MTRKIVKPNLRQKKISFDTIILSNPVGLRSAEQEAPEKGSIPPCIFISRHENPIDRPHFPTIGAYTGNGCPPPNLPSPGAHRLIVCTLFCKMSVACKGIITFSLCTVMRQKKSSTNNGQAIEALPPSRSVSAPIPPRGKRLRSSELFNKILYFRE